MEPSHDLDLWRSMAPAYSEEFLGAPEMQGSTAPMDYDDWPIHVALTKGMASGRISAHWLGLGVDPRSFVADMLVAVVIDAEWQERSSTAGTRGVVRRVLTGVQWDGLTRPGESRT